MTFDADHTCHARQAGHVGHAGHASHGGHRRQQAGCGRAGLEQPKVDREDLRADWRNDPSQKTNRSESENKPIRARKQTDPSQKTNRSEQENKPIRVRKQTDPSQKTNRSELKNRSESENKPIRVRKQTGPNQKTTDPSQKTDRSESENKPIRVRKQTAATPASLELLNAQQRHLRTHACTHARGRTVWSQIMITCLAHVAGGTSLGKIGWGPGGGPRLAPNNDRGASLGKMG